MDKKNLTKFQVLTGHNCTYLFIILHAYSALQYYLEELNPRNLYIEFQNRGHP